MFDSFDYKKAVPALGNTAAGIVKAIYPSSSAGMDQLGGGLGDLLKAVGLEVGEQEQTPATEPKTSARNFDEFGFQNKKAEKQNPPKPQEKPAEQPSDREIALRGLLQRGYSEEEAHKILEGPEKVPIHSGERVAEFVGKHYGDLGKVVASSTAFNPEQPGQKLKESEGKRMSTERLHLQTEGSNNG